MKRKVNLVLLSCLQFAALLLSPAHASSESDALGERLEQTQDPKVAKQLNDLLAWSIGNRAPLKGAKCSLQPLVGNKSSGLQLHVAKLAFFVDKAFANYWTSIADHGWCIQCID